MAVIGLAIGVYILSQQSLRFPLVQEKPKQIKVELSNAQAVQPGQGQTVRVAGVEVGRIADVKLEDGIAVVTLDIEKDYENLIRSDATALLRPKTALKDMFLEVNPGTRQAASARAGASRWRTRCRTSIPTRCTPPSTRTRART